MSKASDDATALTAAVLTLATHSLGKDPMIASREVLTTYEQMLKFVAERAVRPSELRFPQS